MSAAPSLADLLLSCACRRLGLQPVQPDQTSRGRVDSEATAGLALLGAGVSIPHDRSWLYPAREAPGGETAPRPQRVAAHVQPAAAELPPSRPSCGRAGMFLGACAARLSRALVRPPRGAFA